MFGSEAVEKHVFNVVRVLPSVQAAVGDRIYPTQLPPRIPGQPITYPLMIHYPESAPYNQDVIQRGILPTSQTITYIVRFQDRNASAKAIRQANRDAFEALVQDNWQAVVTTEDNETFSLDIGPNAEWTIGTTDVDANGVMFRQKGFALIAYVFRV
jgi:hypothetical protein